MTKQLKYTEEKQLKYTTENQEHGGQKALFCKEFTAEMESKLDKVASGEFKKKPTSNLLAVA